MAEDAFSVPSVYLVLENVLLDKGENLLNKSEVYIITQNLLQWSKAHIYINMGTHTFLTVLFRPFVIKIENK